jgi:hypothetical protein
VAKPDELVDSHVVEGYVKPTVDDCQDWVLKGAVAEGGWIIVETSRMLDTKDGQDHAIKNDAALWDPPTRIIAAWGDQSEVNYHGKASSRSSVRIFADHSHDEEATEMQALVDILEAQSEGHFDIGSKDFEIPAEETTYEDVCVPFDELNITLAEGQTGVTMTGAIPVITEETRPYVHHFVVYAVSDCSWQAMLTRSMIYGWAPGDEGWALPENVGFPLFDGPNNQAIIVQIHYNNPDEIPAMKDSSGVRFYFTNEEREHTAGLLEIGDPLVSMRGTDIADGLQRYQFSCPDKCSTAFLGGRNRDSGESEGVTILSEYLHMHKYGVRMTNEVIRGDEVYHSAVSDVYSYDQQGLHHVAQQPYTVMPGDKFRTTCYYRDGSAFGLASQEEMCVAFLLYYPAVKNPMGLSWMCYYPNPEMPMLEMFMGTDCIEELEQVSLGGDDELGRIFGASSGECAVVPEVDSGSDEEAGDDVPATEPATAPEEGADTPDTTDDVSESGSTTEDTSEETSGEATTAATSDAGRNSGSMQWYYVLSMAFVMFV